MTAASRAAFLGAIAAILAAGLSCAAATAQPLAAPIDPALVDRDAGPGEPLDSPEAVREAVSQMTDAEVRALLLERLDAVARERAAAAQSGGLRAAIVEAADSLRASVVGAVARIPNIPKGVAEGWGRFFAPRGWPGALRLLAVGLAALGLGYAAERLLLHVAASATPPPPRLASRRAGLRETLRFLLRRLATEAAGAATFILVAWAVIAAAHPPEPISYLILTFFLFQPVIKTRIAAAAGRFVFAPNVPAARLLALNDAEARFLHRAVVVFAALVGLRAYTLSFFGGHGADLGSMRLGFWLTLVVYAWMLWVAWRARAAMTRVLSAGGDATPAETWFAWSYPYMSMALIVLVWTLTEIFSGMGLWGFVDERLPLTLAVLIFGPLADVAIRGLAVDLAPDPDGAAMEKTVLLARRTRRGLIRMGRVAALGLAALLLLDLWNVDLAAAAAGALPARAAAGALAALGVATAGYVAMELASLFITRRIIAEAPEADPEEDVGGEGGGAGGSRLSTILPLALRAAQVAIIAITLLEMLAVLGVSIAPLLAGLGIVGLAIGFGAQKLVADIVSGVFFLIDDAFRVGEYVEIDGTVGTVERVSARSLQLRHHEGAVHTIPFGEIPKLTNYSRDWVIMKLRFTVPFDTDLQKVKKIFKQIGKDMAADPSFAGDILQPFKSQGVLEVTDVGIVLRGKFMARPGRQWLLRKEVFARVQKAFEENGVQFARREVRVRIDGDAPRDAETTRQAAAAAAEAISAADAAPSDDARAYEMAAP